MTKLEKFKLLYIDDEEGNLRVFKNLYRRKFEIVTASSAKEGLSLFDEQPFDLVISDQRMPDKNGLELLRAIKKKNPLIPTILLTGYADHDILKEAFNDVGVSKYINKPFDPKNLATVIELAIEGYRLRSEREKIEHELKTSELKFRGIFNSIADVFVRVDNEGIMRVVSPSARDLFGYEADELIGKNVGMLYANPENRKGLIDKIKKAKCCNGMETVILTKNGERKYISSNSKVYYDENNKQAGIESMVRDISDQKKLEQDLRIQGEFLNEVQKMANLGSWQWNILTGEMTFSDTLYKIYGIEEESKQLSFGTYLSYIHHEDRKNVKTTIARAIKSNNSFEFEARIIREDGEKRTLSSWGNTITNKNDIVRKITVACLDITESKLREKALKDSEEKFRLLAEQSPVQIYMVNRKLQVEYANELANMQLDTDNAEKRLIHNYFNKETRLNVINSIANVLEEEKGNYIEFEYLNEKKRTWLALNTSPIKEDDKVVAVLLMIRDITKKIETESMLRNMNEELERKVKKRTRALEKMKNDLEVAFKQEQRLGELKSKFVSTASHQFRTPLTVIQANIGLLEMHIQKVWPEYDKKFKTLNRRIQIEIKRMTELMDNVLLLGKKESGTVKLKLEMIDLYKFIKNVAEKYNQIQEDGRRIEVAIKGTPSLFHLDRELLDHAISNLISNAFKYSLNKPAPHVNVEFRKEKVMLVIQDFGVGIPEEDKDDIFEPFYRARNVEGIAGTGLGMSIAKGYLELMGATIQMESELNKGTTFTIEIKK